MDTRKTEGRTQEGQSLEGKSNGIRIITTEVAILYPGPRGAPTGTATQPSLGKAGRNKMGEGSREKRLPELGLKG